MCKIKVLCRKITAVFLILTICLTILPFDFSFKSYALTANELYPDENAVSFIYGAEGFQSTCFYDNKQWTIGYGTECKGSNHPSNPYYHQKGPHTITKAEANKEAREQLNSDYASRVRRAVGNLEMNQNQFNALLSCAYNHGNVLENGCKYCGYRAMPLVKYLKGEMTEDEAHSKMLTWCIMEGSRDEQGLRNRRRREADLFFSGVPQETWTDVNAQYIVTTNSDPLNMRSSASTSSSLVARIPKGSEVTVIKVNSSGSWGYVNWNGTTGYCSMQYLTKKPEVVIVTPSMPSLSISAGTSYSMTTLNWNNCDNTDFYGIRVYKSDGTQLKYIEPYYGTSYSISLGAGSYYASIASVNSNGNYQICGDVNFTVEKGSAVPIAETWYNGHIYAAYDTETKWSQADAVAKQMGGLLLQFVLPDQTILHLQHSCLEYYKSFHRKLHRRMLRLFR